MLPEKPKMETQPTRCSDKRHAAIQLNSQKLWSCKQGTHWCSRISTETASSWRGHDTTNNKSKGTQFIHLYASMKRYILFAWYLKQKYWFSSCKGTISCAAYDCSAKGPRFEPRTLPTRFGQNLGTCASNERIGKKKIRSCWFDTR